MVERPFEDRRPVGPVLDLEAIGDADKDVIGVTGTPMPGREKNPVIITFVLDGKHQALLEKDVRGDLGNKIKDKIDLSGIMGKVRAIKSGSSSAIPLQNQAIAVTIPGSSLPVQESELNRVINTIERHYDNETTVQTYIIDQE